MSTVSYSFAERAAPVASSAPTSALLGESSAMQQILRLIEKVAPTDASILLTGESGSGKEVAARAIHECSARRKQPFVVIDCGAISARLIEGAFEQADGGTLLLDEVTELPMEMQTRLLRVLESRKFYRLNASTESNADVRVIAATNRCPLTAVKNGVLRQDLLYRLAMFPIEMPPLRRCGDDVDLLADRFLAVLNARARTDKRLSAASRATLRQHSWPGNVRELENCIEQAFILGDDQLELVPLIQSNNLRAGVPGIVEQGAVERARLDIRVGSRIHDMERSLIEATLDYFKGNKRRAADALGCSLKTLYNKLNGYSHSQQCVNS